MRLINIETLMLEEYFGNDIPPYAILSHTWGNDDEEITFRDIEAGRVEKNGSGSSKVRGCCNQARKDGLKYVWIDTCCIDKSSSSELSDCINSMFQWYETASVCYAYLADVPAGDNPRQPDSKFFSSRWFERGWTLQELLAPERVCFYDATWDLLGTKVNLAGAIQSITGIPRHFLLRSVALQSASIAERMSWAAKRRTKREEDLAYCLLGIFNVMMPMLYGERHNAFRRLQEEIMKHGGDDSILAWGFNGNGPEPDTSAIPSPKGPLAASPSDFANSGEIISGYQIPMHTSSIEISADWLRIHLPLHTTPTGNIYGVMKCFQPQCSAEQVVGVPLQKLDSLSHSYIRPPGQPPILLSRSASAAPTNHISVWNPKEGGTSNNQQHWFYIEESKGIDLELIEVEPRHRWLRDKSIITTDNNPSGTNAFQHTLARFRSKTDHSHDIMIVLEYYTSPVKAQFYAMSLSSDATLAEVLSNLEYLLPKAAGKRQVSTSVIHVGVDVTERPIAGQPLFVVSLFSTSHDPETVTTDASSELHVLKSKSRFVEMLHEEDTTESKSRDFDQQAKQQLTVLGEKHAQISAVREKIRKLKEEETLLIEEAEKAAQGAQDAETLRNDLQELLIDLKEQRYDKQRDLVCDPKIALVDIAEMLLTRELDPEPADQSSQALLLEAATQGCYDAVLLLLDDDIDPNIVDRKGNTPLHRASSQGYAQVVSLLITCGARLNFENKDGGTPLNSASAKGQSEVARHLLDRGANISARDKKGYTPLHTASACGRVEVARLLLDRGADISAKHQKGSTPLHCAASRGRTEVSKLLLDRGANVGAWGGHGWRPLHCAASWGNFEVAWLLLERGANTEDMTRDGWTPLHFASMNGHSEVGQLLVDHGANVRAVNGGGDTPSMLAAKWHNSQTTAQGTEFPDLGSGMASLGLNPPGK